MGESKNSKVEEQEFEQAVDATLLKTEAEILSLELVSQEDSQSWASSRSVVANFRPVPWFIWRMSNYVFGTPGRPNKLSEGLVFGLKKLVVAAAQDKVIGGSSDVTSTRQGLQRVQSDALAAVAVIHSIAKRLKSRPYERAWEPLLEDALIRAHIGFFVGQLDLGFGPGRGMLAGFSGRIGLAILIGMGTGEQASHSLELLASGASLKRAGLTVYGIDPIQVSALTLSASGCGIEAALGTVGWGVAHEQERVVESSPLQFQWLAAFSVCESIRTGKSSSIPESFWNALGFTEEHNKEELRDLVKILIRQGHGWDWIINA